MGRTWNLHNHKEKPKIRMMNQKKTKIRYIYAQNCDINSKSNKTSHHTRKKSKTKKGHPKSFLALMTHTRHYDHTGTTTATPKRSRSPRPPYSPLHPYQRQSARSNSMLRPKSCQPLQQRKRKSNPPSPPIEEAKRRMPPVGPVVVVVVGLGLGRVNKANL